MLIYTGEKSKDIPLLIIEDMFHPSKFKETYYIYPFTIDNDLNGILYNNGIFKGVIIPDSHDGLFIGISFQNTVNPFYRELHAMSLTGPHNSLT